MLLPSHYMANHHGYEWLIGPDRALDPAKLFLVATELFGNGFVVVAEQHAGAVSRAALSGDDDPRQRRSGAPAAGRGSEDHARARDHRLLDGRRAGVPVGGQLSRLRRSDRRAPPAPPRRGRTASCVSKDRSPRSPPTRRSTTATTPSPPRKGIEAYGMVLAWLAVFAGVVAP